MNLSFFHTISGNRLGRQWMAKSKCRPKRVLQSELRAGSMGPFGTPDGK